MPLCHLADRAVLRLSGPDTRGFLQGLLTQDMDGLSPATPLYAGLLSPQGKALFQLFLFAEGGDVLIDVAAAQQDALSRRLTMFRLRKQVTIAADPAVAVWQQWGEPCPHPADPRTPQAGSRFLAPPEGPTAPIEAWHQRRLTLGLPDSDEIGHDELLWLETNARELNGVSFTKGCYTGQENTARMHHRDKLRKRLLPLQIAENAPAEGPVLSGDREAGTLRGQRHADLQMALIRMDYLNQPLTLNGSPAVLLTPSWLTAES